jgi:translocation and assembly module TamB
VLSELRGRLEVHGKAERRNAAEAPSFEISLATHGLVAQGVPKGAPPWRTEGLDARALVATDGPTRGAHVDTELVDARGTVASASADAPLPLGELLAEGADLATRLMEAPLSAHLHVPRRALAQMPRIAPRAPLEGEVQLDADVRGTASHPLVTLAARAFGLHPAHDPLLQPFDASIDATYDGARAVATAQVQRKEATLLDAHAELDVAATDLIAGRKDLFWTASCGAAMHDFPLENITPIADKHVRGDVSGSFELQGLHTDASLDARLEATRLQIDKAIFTRGLLTMSARQGNFDARARLDQGDGYGDVHARAGIAWGAAIAPSMDPARPLDIAVDAKKLRAAAAKPFLEGITSELDGRLDSDLRMSVRADKAGEATGAIVFDQGRVEFPALGEELKNAHAKISIQPWGTVRVDDVSAEGATGRLKAWGSASLDGLAFHTGEGHVRIDKGNKLPLLLEGVALGDAWGAIDAKAEAKDGAIDLHLEVPSLHLDLPASAAHPVQSLDPDSHIDVGVRDENGAFRELLLGPKTEKRSSSASHLHLVAHLGDDVEIRRDHSLQISLAGAPVVDVTDTTRVSGEIRLVLGKIEVQGKMFEIEKGTVNFTGQDPGNPVVVATAYYDAPDGTRVYADFTGPVRTGKLTLRSEPAHSQDEILAILLFGSPEGSFGASTVPGQDSGAAAKAAGLGGSYVAQGVNKALSGVTKVDVATRIDTSQADNPRPQLEVQLAKDVGVHVVYNLGVPAPGQSPDRTLLVIDWRFVRRWLLETTIGDQGSSMVDLIWKYRY